MSRSASVPTNDPPGTSSVTLRPSFSTACACWCRASMHCSRVGKEPTESQGDEAPIIQSVQVPWAEADVTRVSRQSKASGSRKWPLPARVYQRRQASGEPCLLLLRYHASMPAAPTNERQALERERAELPPGRLGGAKTPDYLTRMKMAFLDEGATPTHRRYGWVVG